ncbi:programmed cell death protein 2-like [Ptychodera flava]|uniref:programmed cell death protein 2-like n=1 Tax=Ptychodera flava TaxID=63121 RepID=UPI003969F705
MAASSKSDVELGFAEKTHGWRLNSKYFPCKFGGKPSWLHLKNLPLPESLQCSCCKNPYTFLLQIYAPINELKTCFHRTVFVFCCRSAECYKPNSNLPFAAFRSQLPRKNDYYSYHPPTESEDSKPVNPVDFEQRMCEVCGCLGPKRCGKCHETNYCSRNHQMIDWKEGHKFSCGKDEGRTPEYKNVLFPEYEVVIETEELNTAEETDKSEEDKMRDYSEFMKSEQGKSMLRNEDMTQEDLEKMALHEEDVQFKKFRERINHEPEQILRYDRGGEPLWISSKHIPKSNDIPLCQCGAPRIFEFQILPQLLNYLHVDSLGASIDWGTLAIYTCSKNCDTGPVYHPEFVWKQECGDTPKIKTEDTVSQ